MPRAMVLSTVRTERMYSYTSPPSSPADSAACRKGSRCSSTWSKARRGGKPRTSSRHKPLASFGKKGGFRAAFTFWKGVLGAGLLHSVQGVEEVEKVSDAGDLERILHAFTHADEIQAPSVLLMGDVSAHQGTDAGGINIGDLGQVQKKSGGGVGANFGLEVKQIA